MRRGPGSERSSPRRSERRAWQQWQRSRFARDRKRSAVSQRIPANWQFQRTGAIGRERSLTDRTQEVVGSSPTSSIFRRGQRRKMQAPPSGGASRPQGCVVPPRSAAEHGAVKAARTLSPAQQSLNLVLRLLLGAAGLLSGLSNPTQGEAPGARRPIRRAAGAARRRRPARECAVRDQARHRRPGHDARARAAACWQTDTC